MCGGYYEEEIMEDMKFTTAENMMKEYYGPTTKFSSTPAFGRAVALCKLENIECRIDPHVNTIHFEDVKAEERFTIAWSKAVAGSQR